MCFHGSYWVSHLNNPISSHIYMWAPYTVAVVKFYRNSMNSPLSTRTLHYHPGSNTRSIKAIKNVSCTNYYFNPFAQIQKRSCFHDLKWWFIIYFNTVEFISFSSFVQIGSLPLFSIKSRHFQIRNAKALAKVANIIDFMMVLTNAKTQNIHFLQFSLKVL